LALELDLKLERGPHFNAPNQDDREPAAHSAGPRLRDNGKEAVSGQPNLMLFYAWSIAQAAQVA